LTRTATTALERTIRRGGGGRPTRKEAEARDVRLLDVATSLFMERGFDGTSIDAVCTENLIRVDDVMELPKLAE
jgi:TetR/AcrR family transcriptional regulator, mexJK operon transcriptional repressor